MKEDFLKYLKEAYDDFYDDDTTDQNYVKPIFSEEDEDENENISSKENAEEVSDNQNISVGYLDKDFIVKLINYLDKIFPSFGEFDKNVGVELKKHMPIGTEEKMKEVKRTKKKINDIIQKEKQRFLMKVQNRVENIKINK